MSGSMIVGAVRFVDPGDSLRAAIEDSAAGDVLILRDGVYSGPVLIDKSVTLRAEHPGEVTITNRYEGEVEWKRMGDRIWRAEGIEWPVHWLWVNGIHAFDYRTRENFEQRACGPFWSKGWQEGMTPYPVPPISFAWEEETASLWLRLNDDRNPNALTIEFHRAGLNGDTLVQKDLGTSWNQQEVVRLASSPFPQRVTMWYQGTFDAPSQPRYIDYPGVCGVLVAINADNVILDGIRFHVAPTVGVDVKDSHHVTIRECYFSGYQFGINTGYTCTHLTVEHCEFDGGRLVSFGGHRGVNENMWCHSTYVIPVKFNGTGLIFRHNYIYEGYDLFHPRGRHKNYPEVPDLRSDIAFNLWHVALDNAIEFDSVEARMNLRFHHNLVLADHDALAITTTENGAPLTIDHNIWWPGGHRIMKLVGTGRTNRGVDFVHNTYFSGEVCSFNGFEDSRFENNIVMSNCETSDCWTRERLGAFFPGHHNLLRNGDRYTAGFEGLVADPLLGDTPATRFVIQAGSPAIDAGVENEVYYQDNVSDGIPDLGALEAGQGIDDWRRIFGHCGPTWITYENRSSKAPNRPDWPKELDRRWGGLDAAEIE